MEIVKIVYLFDGQSLQNISIPTCIASDNNYANMLL